MILRLIKLITNEFDKDYAQRSGEFHSQCRNIAMHTSVFHVNVFSLAMYACMRQCDNVKTSFCTVITHLLIVLCGNCYHTSSFPMKSFLRVDYLAISFTLYN